MNKIKDDIQINILEEKLIDQVPKTYVLINNHWDTINKNLSRNMSMLIRHIGEYRNRNISKLETPYPIDAPPWTPDNDRILYKVTGIDPEEFLKSVLTIRGLDDYLDPFLADKCTNILLIMIARWCIQNKREKELAIVTFYIGYSYYWSNFYKYFNVYKPKLSVMMYTIDNMSYKNLLKSTGSVDKWLYDGVTASIATYSDKLMNGADFDLHYIGEKLRGKFDGYMKNLFREVDKNNKAGNHVFISSDEVADTKVENSSGIAETISLAEKYTTKFFSSPINEKAIRGSKMVGGITERDLRNTIFLIADDSANLNDVKNFYQSLFHIFLTDSDYTIRDIGSLKFYKEMQKLYKPGNTHDKNRLIIRDTLDRWNLFGADSA